jgi:YggT family protein
VRHILQLLISVYLVVLFARAVTSWFPPPRRGTPVAFLTQLLRDLTEPVLAPLRRVIPPAGPFDLSFMVLFFILLFLQSFLR